MSSLSVDHVIYAVTDLDAAGEGLAGRLGLASVAGGVHPDRERRIASSHSAPRTSSWWRSPIEWSGDPELHPGRAMLEHPVRPLGISWISLSADQRELAEWLGGADLPVRVTEGPPAVTAVGIATADGEIVVT